MKFRDGQLWQRIVARAADAPSHPAYIDPAAGLTLSYGELIAHASAVATEAHGDSTPSLLVSANTTAFAPRFLSLLLAGRAIMPVSLETPASELSRHAASLAAMSDKSAGLLLATSGTTGAAKIVRRSIASLDAVSAAMVHAIGFRSDDRIIAAVPLVHSYGLEHGLLAPLWAGATVLLCDGLDLQPLTAALSNGATILPAVPSAIELLARLSQSIDTAALRRVYTAGAPLPPGIATAFEQRFGVGVGQVYGSTEIGSVVYRDPLRDARDSVGRAMNGVSIRILTTDDDRRVVLTGEDGEVAVAAPSMLAGYINQPAALIDGHFPTGDIGHLNESGELTLTGRVRLMIDVGGAKVNPLEVERVLESHPAVAAAVVLPLRLSETINKIRAIVVPTDPASPPTVAALRIYARQQLAAFKIPRQIDFAENLPRTPAGKVARKQLQVSECRP